MSCEILAPAGSPEALTAAVRCGADAVYLGMGGFNARRGASNFDRDSLRDAVRFCHSRGVRVHLTLNTLVGDGELRSAAETLKDACDAGIDAVIVQDLGIASLIRSACPSLEMHASTQMSVHSESALPLMKSLGFKRVVLAREMSREEIKSVTAAAKKLGIETEVFVHGALCMCLSGQCYMSSVIGRRSGNRGMCAQPCRLPFAGGGFPLSLKDMSLLDYVSELEKTGVSSLKIEGRMKRPEYVAAAVSAFRSASDGKNITDEQRSLLNDVFSRSGHTDGYYLSQYGGNMFGHRTEDDATASKEALNSIHALYRGEYRHIPIDISFNVSSGAPSEMTMSDGRYKVTSIGQVPQSALNRPLSAEHAEQMCSKLGDTPFIVKRFDCRIGDGLMLPASAVNAMRRECCEKLLKAREGKPVPFSMPRDADLTVGSCSDSHGHGRNHGNNEKPLLFASFADVRQLPDGLGGLDRVYVPLGSELPVHKCVGVEIPRALFEGEDRIFARLEGAKAHGAKYALCHNYAAVRLAEKAGLEVHAGFGLNAFNSLSVSELCSESVGAKDVTLSFELTLAAAKSIADNFIGSEPQSLKENGCDFPQSEQSNVETRSGCLTGIIAYGRLPLMITRNCPLGGKRKCATCSHSLTDRKNVTFPIACNGSFSEILNQKTLLVSPQKDRLDGFGFLMLRFTDETSARAGEVIDSFRSGADIGGDFTHGLYYRGVL